MFAADLRYVLTQSRKDAETRKEETIELSRERFLCLTSTGLRNDPVEASPISTLIPLGEQQ